MDEVMKKLKDHDNRFDTFEKRLDQHDGHLDTIARTVVAHTERLDRIAEKMATKDDLSGISKTLDHLVKLAEKKDQELIILGHNVKKVTDRVELLETNAKGMKPALGLS